jgi:hypothetical protein
MRMTRATHSLDRGGDGEDDAMVVMVMAIAMKKTVPEDDNAGTTAVTGATRSPSKPKQTAGTTPKVDQHHHRWDIRHLRKQQWRWERPFYSS